MYKENGKVSEAHEPSTEPEHTPRGNLQGCANLGKNHANPTPYSTRAGEQERSQAHTMQTPTMHTMEAENPARAASGAAAITRT